MIKSWNSGKVYREEKGTPVSATLEMVSLRFTYVGGKNSSIDFPTVFDPTCQGFVSEAKASTIWPLSERRMYVPDGREGNTALAKDLIVLSVDIPAISPAVSEFEYVLNGL
ncbi:hypothetical protein [Leptospira perdikensis]|uniref:hypothetical protein n=1 Tax=Leptospira perdikensis TaxID=2484948 RepID=UPI001FC8EEFE|nr:hypothetical protein [Leptospira perdikensis]